MTRLGDDVVVAVLKKVANSRCGGAPLPNWNWDAALLLVWLVDD